MILEAVEPFLRCQPVHIRHYLALIAAWQIRGFLFVLEPLQNRDSGYWMLQQNCSRFLEQPYQGILTMEHLVEPMVAGSLLASECRGWLRLCLACFLHRPVC